MGGKGDIWVDHMILPGANWKQDLWVKLHQSDLVLFLMSSDSIDSEFIWTVELKKTFDRAGRGEVEFIPIFLRDCQWQEIPDIARFQVIPGDNKPMIHNTLWGSHDEPFSQVTREVNRSVETIWQRINHESIEQNRPRRFLGIRQFLQGNPHFFDMDKTLHNSAPHHSEDVVYFISIKNYLTELAEQIRSANDNGLHWVEETLEQLELFRDICKKMETVWRCSDYVWIKLEQLHTQALIKAEIIEKHISAFTGADVKKIDHYMAIYALPFLFALEEYCNVLEELVDESLSAQSQ